MKSHIALTTLALLLGALPAYAKDTGIAYVSSEKDHAITMVDLKTLAVVGTIKTCKRPRHLQLLPGALQMMVACGDSNRADVIDLASRAVAAQIPLGDDPEAFDLSPDGKLAYVSAEEEGALNVFDLAAKKLVKSVPVGKEPEGVKVSPTASACTSLPRWRTWST